MEWILEAVLVLLLAATLFHALRLERALGVLKRDRAVLEDLVTSFNASTRQAEAGIEQLRVAADGAGRQMARQIDTVTRLKDDLVFLLDRGEHLADRLDSLVRAGRPLAAEALRPIQVADDDQAGLPRVRSQAERDLLKALRMAR
ncbi:MAG TPA: DUF6468 domain-containing protein [Acetobacteraceae bacterium]